MLERRHKLCGSIFQYLLDAFWPHDWSIDWLGAWLWLRFHQVLDWLFSFRPGGYNPQIVAQQELEQMLASDRAKQKRVKAREIRDASVSSVASDSTSAIPGPSARTPSPHLTDTSSMASPPPPSASYTKARTAKSPSSASTSRMTSETSSYDFSEVDPSPSSSRTPSPWKRGGESKLDTNSTSTSDKLTKKPRGRPKKTTVELGSSATTGMKSGRLASPSSSSASHRQGRSRFFTVAHDGLTLEFEEIIPSDVSEFDDADESEDSSNFEWTEKKFFRWKFLLFYAPMYFLTGFLVYISPAVHTLYGILISSWSVVPFLPFYPPTYPSTHLPTFLFIFYLFFSSVKNAHKNSKRISNNSTSHFPQGKKGLVLVINHFLCRRTVRTEWEKNSNWIDLHVRKMLHGRNKFPVTEFHGDAGLNRTISDVSSRQTPASRHLGPHRGPPNTVHTGVRWSTSHTCRSRTLWKWIERTFLEQGISFLIITICYSIPLSEPLCCWGTSNSINCGLPVPAPRARCMTEASSRAFTMLLPFQESKWQNVLSERR